MTARDSRWEGRRSRSDSMGAFHGNFGALVRAWAYICTLGKEGIPQISEDAVINANYILSQLRGYYSLPYDRICMHEVVLSATNLKRENGVRGAGCGQASDRLRNTPADDVLSADRGRGAEDRADGDGVEGDSRHVHRGDEDDSGGGIGRPGPAKGTRRTIHPDTQGRRGPSRAEARPPVAAREAVVVNTMIQ